MARADHQWITIRKLVRAAGEGYAYEPESLYEKLKKSDAPDPLPLRLLSISGGILSAATFSGFIFISGIVQDGIHSLIAGFIFLVLSILLPRWRSSLAFDTFNIALQVVGSILIAMGLADLGWNDQQIAPLFLLIGILTVTVTRSKTQAFLSAMLCFTGILFWMNAGEWQDGLHFYNFLTVTAMTALMFTEAQALEKGGRILWLYLPLRNAVILACFTGFILLTGGERSPWPTPRWIWLSYLPVAVALLILIRHVSTELLETDKKRQRKWMMALLLLTLPTAMNPAISASLLMMLLGFYTGHRSAFVMGLLGLPLFIGIWYYDLPISLLQKSIWMMVTGIACMVTYLLLIFINKEDAEG